MPPYTELAITLGCKLHACLSIWLGDCNIPQGTLLGDREYCINALQTLHDNGRKEDPAGIDPEVGEFLEKVRGLLENLKRKKIELN